VESDIVWVSGGGNCEKHVEKGGNGVIYVL
jgi:hypothetical protein